MRQISATEFKARCLALLDEVADSGEPLEILVNQKLIARGDVVVVNEKFGIRLTDILSPMERIKQLG